MGIGSFPLCRFMYLTAFGASCARPRHCTLPKNSVGGNEGREGRRGESNERMKDMDSRANFQTPPPLHDLANIAMSNKRPYEGDVTSVSKKLKGFVNPFLLQSSFPLIPFALVVNL